MNDYLIAILILIVGIVVFILLLKSNVHYYVLLFVILLTLGLVAYSFNDTVTESKQIINKDGTNSTGCDTNFKLTTDSKGNPVCYNESPFGHSIISLFGLLAGSFGLCYVAQITFKSWRMYLTPKILYYQNKYLNENRPINRYIDNFESGDFVWSYKGYGFIMNSKDNEIHVSRKNLVYRLQSLLLFKGRAQKITSQQLFEFVDKNERIFSQIMNGFNYDKKTHKASAEESGALSIFIPVELSNNEKELYYSRRGNFRFNADRARYAILELFKMRKAIKILNTDMTGTTNNTLATGVSIADKASVIGSRVNSLRESEVVKGAQPLKYQNNNQQQQQNTQNQRGQM